MKSSSHGKFSFILLYLTTNQCLVRSSLIFKVPCPFVLFVVLLAMSFRSSCRSIHAIVSGHEAFFGFIGFRLQPITFSIYSLPPYFCGVSSIVVGLSPSLVLSEVLDTVEQVLEVAVFSNLFVSFVLSLFNRESISVISSWWHILCGFGLFPLMHRH